MMVMMFAANFGSLRKSSMNMKRTFAIAFLVLVTQLEMCWAFTSGFLPRNRRLPSHGASTSRQQPDSRVPLQAAFISEIASAYSYGLTNFHLATESMTGGVLCGVGDAMAQINERIGSEDEEKQAEESDAHPIDYGRLARFALKGLGGGMIWSGWYSIVDGLSLEMTQNFLAMISPDDPLAFGENAERAGRTVSSILLEQFIAAPLVYSLWDIPFPMLMSGAPVESVPGQVKSKIGGLLMENAKVWSFVNIIIYNLPLKYRLPAMCTADVFWQAVVAGVAAEATADADTTTDFETSEQQRSKEASAEKRRFSRRLTE